VNTRKKKKLKMVNNKVKVKGKGKKFLITGRKPQRKIPRRKRERLERLSNNLRKNRMRS
jgi:hypothetical protein